MAFLSASRVAYGYAPPTSPIRQFAGLTSGHYWGNESVMKIATSRLTSQGQVSIPLEVRKRLGLAPGSTIEWDAEGDQVVVKRGGKYTFDDLHKVAFPGGQPELRTLEEMKAGIAEYLRAKHARR